MAADVADVTVDESIFNCERLSLMSGLNAELLLLLLVWCTLGLVDKLFKLFELLVLVLLAFGNGDILPLTLTRTKTRTLFLLWFSEKYRHNFQFSKTVTGTNKSMDFGVNSTHKYNFEVNEINTKPILRISIFLNFYTNWVNIKWWTQRKQKKLSQSDNNLFDFLNCH